MANFFCSSYVDPVLQDKNLELAFAYIPGELLVSRLSSWGTKHPSVRTYRVFAYDGRVVPAESRSCFGPCVEGFNRKEHV